MKGHAIQYFDDELAWIEANKDMPRRELHAMFCARFQRDDVSLGAFKGLCKRKGWHTGRTGQFAKGNVSHNKGKKMPYNPNSAATQFKKGERRGRANENYQPIGTERVSKDGYLERKIHDGLPLQSRWRAVHLVRWEEIHGPLPKGHALKCLDGDKTNTDPSNWEAIPRALLPRLNGRFGRGYDHAPPELKPTIMAIAKLAQKAQDARKEQG
ncbi:HNH endonuclease [Halodurantibacterium flavum]|uniref:HNH endonuclease n=1 Tax=Halodurantibacterium flavum TaxID=1382802 RepID=A0ABW4S9Z1_9RHOB